jgi:hypothetical protein
MAYFNGFKMHENESIDRYYIRFNKMCRLILSSGVNLSKNKILDQFLRGIKHHPNQTLNYHIQTYRALRLQQQPLALSTIAADLARVEEDQPDRFQSHQRQNNGPRQHFRNNPHPNRPFQRQERRAYAFSSLQVSDQNRSGSSSIPAQRRYMPETPITKTQQPFSGKTSKTFNF